MFVIDSIEKSKNSKSCQIIKWIREGEIEFDGASSESSFKIVEDSITCIIRIIYMYYDNSITLIRFKSNEILFPTVDSQIKIQQNPSSDVSAVVYREQQTLVEAVGICSS